MEHFWTLYWITRLDSLGTLFVFLATVFAFGAFGCAVVYGCEAGSIYSKPNQSTLKTSKRWGVIFVLVALLFSTAKALLPSKEDAYFIAAGVGITEAVKSETAQRLASKSVGVIEQWLDKQRDAIGSEKERNNERRNFYSAK